MSPLLLSTSLLSSLTTVMDIEGRAVIIPLFGDILRNTGLDVEILLSFAYTASSVILSVMPLYE